MNYYVVAYELWPLYEPGEYDLGRHGDVDVQEADSEIGAINAVLYYVRARKSKFELSYVKSVDGPFEDSAEAREFIDEA